MVKSFTEYEDAPSGSVYFYNYKEPLMKFDEGFGFLGALLFDDKSDKIQCHFCGDWFEALGHHLHKEHNMSAAQYKEKVGLNKTTALINERVRATLIKHGLEQRMKNLRPMIKHSEESKRKISESLKELRAEKQNQTNTCPEQLIERLTVLYNKLGRTPTDDEITFRQALKRVYGSTKEACRFAGIPYRIPGTVLSYKDRTKYTEEKITSFVREFYSTNKRLPLGKEIPSGARNQLKKMNKNEVFKKALSSDGIFRPLPIQKSVRYTKEELIEFLRMFERVNNRKPSYSDSKRMLVPSLVRYSWNFGSWKNALSVAFPN